MNVSSTGHRTRGVAAAKSCPFYDPGDLADRLPLKLDRRALTRYCGLPMSTIWFAASSIQRSFPNSLWERAPEEFCTRVERALSSESPGRTYPPAPRNLWCG